MTKIDTELQAQVDAQLMEQGAFTALDLLIHSGRLMYSDYESWRRGELEFLDTVLMGHTGKIRAQIEEAAGYARSIGLVEQPQEFYPWQTQTQDQRSRPLRISADAQVHRLFAGRYVPGQDAPQMDLFFDNPVVALTNGLVQALCARNLTESQRQLDRLYEHAPNHADLPAFDRLLTALTHLERTVEDAQAELAFLLDVTPAAKRLLGAHSRDLLSPLWRQLAGALASQPFSPEQPELHASFALIQAQDWTGASQCVLKEPEWWRHPALCLRLAQSSFYRQRRTEALTAWCYLCWQAPEKAADVLDNRLQPDSTLAGLWRQFMDLEDEAGEDEPALTAADFPAWMLLHEPGLAQQLAEDLPRGDSAGEHGYRCVHRLNHARRAKRQDEMQLRRALQANHPALFRYLKRSL